MKLMPYIKYHKDGTEFESYIDIQQDIEQLIINILYDLGSGYSTVSLNGLVCTEEDRDFHGTNYGNILWGRIMSWIY